jgi:transposase
MFTFLRQPGLDVTNWRAEPAIRFGVILRKVWGGSRTWAGAWAQSFLMSARRTCWQHGRLALDFLNQLLRAAPAALALLPDPLCTNRGTRKTLVLSLNRRYDALIMSAVDWPGSWPGTGSVRGEMVLLRDGKWEGRRICLACRLRCQTGGPLMRNAVSDGEIATEDEP